MGVCRAILPLPCRGNYFSPHLLLRFTNNLHTVQAQGLCIPFLLIFLPQARSKCRISISHTLFPAPTTDKLFPPSPLHPGDTLPSKDVHTSRCWLPPPTQKSPHTPISPRCSLPKHTSATDCSKHSTCNPPASLSCLSCFPPPTPSASQPG